MRGDKDYPIARMRGLYRKRLDGLRAYVEKNGLDGALVINSENIYYLTGSPFVIGSSGGKLLYVSREGTDSLILSALDYDEAHDRVKDVELVKVGWGEKLFDRLKRVAGKRLAFEENFVSSSLRDSLKKNYELKPLKGVLEKMRAVKDAGEVAKIEESQKAAERALEKASKVFKEGMSELEIASELEYNLRREGAESYAFECLVASGQRGAYTHGMPTKKKVGGGEPVVMDFGVKVSGYCSDMTRTVFFGKPKDEMAKIYSVVLESQEAALRASRPGIKGRELDAVARRIIEGEGYGQYFGHGLGHGVGIAVHEEPSVRPSAEEELVPWNVVTIEPGIYIPKLGGVRIEDMVLITEKGSRDLTGFSKELLIF
jgi:Xaa-Pro aminopeptidase